MRSKILWIIGLVLLAGFLSVQAIMRVHKDMEIVFAFIAFELFAGFLAVAVASALIAALAALIPFGKKEYKEKFKITLPLCLVIIAGLFLLVFGFQAYIMKTHGNGAAFGKEYDEVSTAGVNCSTIINGKFRTGNLLIDREADKQVQWEINSNEKETYTVIWVSDCEYHLLTPGTSDIQLKVKITEVNKEGYRCYVLGLDTLAYEYIIKFR